MPHLLIVDDYSMLLETLQVALAEEYSISIARSGLEALAMIEQCGPDLVITDYSMHGMNGLELIAQIKARGYGMPIIFYSAMLNHQLAAKALQIGAAACLPKPFDLLEMKRVIKEMLDNNT